MGDSLDIGNNAVNGIKLDGDKQCLNSDDDDRCISDMPTGDFLVVKRTDDSIKVNDTDTGEEYKAILSHITASHLVDNEYEDYLKHEVDEGDGNSNNEPDPSCFDCFPSKVDDSDNRNDENTGENNEPMPSPLTANPSVDEHEDYLNLEVKNIVDNDDFKSSEFSPSHSQSKTDDSDDGIDADIGHSDKPLPPHSTASPSVDDENEDCLSLEGKNEVDDNEADSDSESCTSRSPSRMDNSDIRNNISTEENDASLPLHDSASHLVDKHADDLILGAENDISADDMNDNVSDDDESDPSHSVTDDRRPDIASDSCFERLVDQPADTDFCVSANGSCLEILTSAAGDSSVECQSSTVQDDLRTHQKSVSHATADTESATSETDKLPSITTDKSDDTCDTGESHAVVSPKLQLEHKGDEAKIEAGMETDDVLPCSAADSDPEISFSVSATQVSATSTDVATSTAQSLSSQQTAVINAPMLSGLNISVLPPKAAVLPGSSSVTSSNSLAIPAQQTSKPLVVSLPSAPASSGNTRMMSKILQDAGLLLVSQRVFKNLASIQKRKVGSSQAKDDMELLQKLKASYRNLVAKNHGLLIAERKCWCGFRSESVNVIEKHRTQCHFQGHCCYCHGKFVYRTQKMMMNHLWKVHKKVGHYADRSASIQCGFCPLVFSTQMQSLRHMEFCRRKFLLAANLAPNDSHKDIPVFAAVKQPVQQRPVVVASTQKPPVTARQISPRNIIVPPATSASPSILPPVALQLTPVPRNLGPGTPLVQIGNQLFTLLPAASVASSSIALNQSLAKSVSKLTVGSAVQTAQNTNVALPVRMDSRSTKPTAVQAIRMPAASVSQPARQYSPPCTKCRVCNTFVKDQASLLVHMHIAHRWDGSTHKMCQYCCSPDVTFPSLSELHLHIAKFHTAVCWICQSQYQPPDRIVAHLAERHKVTMFKMLDLRRCYFCSSVPPLQNCTAFEEHMMKSHAQQFSDTGKLWDHIRLSPDADKNWFAKQNPDGTLECPVCEGQFISATFLYRHVYLEHSGTFVKLVHCSVCRKCIPSNILLVHLAAAHTRKCSVKVSEIDMSDDECIFVPPVGTKRLKNKRGERVSSSSSIKRAKVAAEAVIISDDNDTDSEVYEDHSSDEDFVVSKSVNIQPASRLCRSIHTRLDHRNSSTDDVCEVIESIVDSGESETVSERSVSFRNAPVGHASSRRPATVQFCNGITEDEVEIIESIVPTIRDKHHRPVSKPSLIKSSDRNYTVTASTADRKHRSSVAVDVHASGDRNDVELNFAEHRSNSCQQSSTKSGSALSESSAQKLMARDQITMNSVEDVLEIDGETVLIVHDDEDDDDDDD